VIAYQTRVGTGGARLAPMLAAGDVDALAFASPSAVDGFLDRLTGLGYPAVDVASLPVGCIGPTTADRARERGFRFVTTSSRQTSSGLVDALEAALAPVRKGVARCF
jgi:uroporphyrinogen-III synthase